MCVYQIKWVTIINVAVNRNVLYDIHGISFRFSVYQKVCIYVSTS